MVLRKKKLVPPSTDIEAFFATQKRRDSIEQHKTPFAVNVRGEITTDTEQERRNITKKRNLAQAENVTVPRESNTKKNKNDGVTHKETVSSSETLQGKKRAKKDGSNRERTVVRKGGTKEDAPTRERAVARKSDTKKNTKEETFLVACTDVGIKTLSMNVTLFDASAQMNEQFEILSWNVVDLTRDGENANNVNLTVASDRALTQIENWASQLARTLSLRFGTHEKESFLELDVIGVERQHLVSASAPQVLSASAGQARATQHSNHRINMLSMALREHFVTVYKKYGGTDTTKVQFASAQNKDCIVCYHNPRNEMPTNKTIKKYGVAVPVYDLPENLEEEWPYPHLVRKAKRTEIKEEVSEYRGRKKFSIKQTLRFLHTQKKCRPWLTWYCREAKCAADPADSLRHSLRILLDLHAQSKKRKRASTTQNSEKSKKSKKSRKSKKSKKTQEDAPMIVGTVENGLPIPVALDGDLEEYDVMLPAQEDYLDLTEECTDLTEDVVDLCEQGASLDVQEEEILDLT